MSKLNWLLIPTTLALVIMALFGARLLPGPVVAEAQSPTPAPSTTSLPRTVTVIGEGTVSVKPDVATATVGVEVVAATVKDATSQASSNMDKVMAALKAAGVQDKDIQTSNYSITFERSSEPKPATSNNEGTVSAGLYRVSNMVTVKIRDLTKVGQIMDDVVNAGANTIWGVNFTVDDATKARSDARAKAVDDAATRAAELARLSNVTLGDVLEVSEVVGAMPIYGAKVNSAVGMGGGGAGPISPGETQISMQLQVTYAIK
jgi:uncharacterized protein